MHRRFGFVWSLCLLGALALASPATATSAVLMPRDQLVKKSELVVHATVGRSVSEWNAEETHIITRTIVKVASYLKGRGERELTVEQLGGTIGDKTMVVSGDTQLRQDQEIVLFLKRGEGDVVHLTALSQAAYTVKDGRVQRDMTGISLFRSVQGKLLPVHRLDEPKETLAHLKADVVRFARTP